MTTFCLLSYPPVITQETVETIRKIRRYVMPETNILCRKIKLYPIGDKEEVDRAYQFIRDGQYAQYTAANIYISQLAAHYYQCNRDFKTEKFIAGKKEILSASNPALAEIEFATGVDTKSLVSQKVSQDFATAIKNGLARGERAITNYKRTMPLLTRSRDLRFKHNHEDYLTFEELLYTNQCEIIVKWVNKIQFKVVLGSVRKSAALRSELKNIIEGTYKVLGSSIQFDKSGRNIMLNLTISIPKTEVALDESLVVGVDLNVLVPARISLNTNTNVSKQIGVESEFVRVRRRMQSIRTSMQTNMKYGASGGKGRKKKLKALNNANYREKNFVQTHNHTVSREIVNFALKHSAKYINVEKIDVNDIEVEKWVKRNWSYSQLLQYISYKAENYGIIVREVKRVGRTPAEDIFLASKKIARSKEFVQDKEKPKTKKKNN